MSEAKGIFQSDVIIRAAIIEAFKRLQADTQLIDYVFRGLREDELTSADYGDNEIGQAKKWLSNTDIPVMMNTRLDEGKYPCVAISLRESVETEATLGDIHYVTNERTEGDWPIVGGPFAPKAYSPSSGMMKLPAAFASSVTIGPGMSVIDTSGRPHAITEVLDADLVSLAPNTFADFSRAFIKGSRMLNITPLESLSFRETYSISVFAQGESVHGTYLFSAMCFLLLRYKEELLEGRGFERSTVSWSEFASRQDTPGENLFARTCTVTGYVRNFWPKNASREIEGMASSLDVSKLGETDDNFVNDQGEPGVGSEAWLASKLGIEI